jgi:hypothetical protein
MVVVAHPKAFEPDMPEPAASSAPRRCLVQVLSYPAHTPSIPCLYQLPAIIVSLPGCFPSMPASLVLYKHSGTV